MKKLIVLFAIFSTGLLFAQDPMLQSDAKDLEPKAKAITASYNEELALTSKQYMLFEKKVEEFLIRREKIELRYNGKEKLDMLFALQQRETKEMNDILTRPQLQVYKKIKPTVQPIDKVK